MSEKELSPCPFCGAKSEWKTYYYRESFQNRYIKCTNCYFQTNEYVSLLLEPKNKTMNTQESEYQRTSNSCVFIRDGQLFVRSEDGEFLPYPYDEMSKQMSRKDEILFIAATFIRKYCAEGEIFYDGADCDGTCLADDCEFAAEG